MAGSDPRHTASRVRRRELGIVTSAIRTGFSPRAGCRTSPLETKLKNNCRRFAHTRGGHQGSVVAQSVGRLGCARGRLARRGKRADWRPAAAMGHCRSQQTGELCEGTARRRARASRTREAGRGRAGTGQGPPPSLSSPWERRSVLSDTWCSAAVEAWRKPAGDVRRGGAARARRGAGLRARRRRAAGRYRARARSSGSTSPSLLPSTYCGGGRAWHGSVSTRSDVGRHPST